MIVLIILAVVLIFSVLVLAHEYGHYKTALRQGVEVEEFGIGFPPKIYGYKKGKTLYSINALPIGGFVRLKGEDGQDTSKGSFAAAGFRSQSKIIMAGVAVNFVIAYILFTILLAVGMPPMGLQMPSVGPLQPQTVTTQKLTVFSLSSSGAAATAGIKQGDELVAINGTTLTGNDQLRTLTKTNAGQTITLTYIHNGQEQTKQIPLGTDEQKGILGVNADQMSLVRYSWWQAPIAALLLMGQLIFATLAAFGTLIVGLFTRAQVSEQVSGPIGVVSIFSQVVQFGPRFIILFVASISLSLAVINALPLPALDGGRQLMLILRKTGLKITPERENLIHIAGFIALIALMLVISWSDIVRLRG